ncbi:major facilitator superfamily domain-containing protein [Aspergillus tetrazonus]
MTETTPLLQNARQSPDSTGPTRLIHRRSAVIVLIAVIVFVIDLGASMQSASQVAVYEKIICQRYLSGLSLVASPEACKADPIQSELAAINGWKNTLDMIPGIVLGAPYGFMADQRGRWPVLILSMGGMLLAQTSHLAICWLQPAVPLRAVWLPPFFQLIGGGGATATTVLSVVVADLYSEEERPTILSRIFGIIFAAQLLGMAITGLVISLDPWIPFATSVVMMMIGCVLTCFLPETHPRITAAKIIHPCSPSELATGSENQARADSANSTLLGMMRQAVNTIYTIMANGSARGIIACLLAEGMGTQSTSLLLQYASTRFGWTYAEGTNLLAVKLGISTSILLIIFPWLSRALATKLSSDQKWLLKALAQASLAFLMIGYLVVFLSGRSIGLIGGIVTTALGAGSELAARNLLMAVVEPEILGLACSAIPLVQSIASLASLPMLVASFRWGIHQGNGWVGAPFLIATVLCALASVALTTVRV